MPARPALLELAHGIARAVDAAGAADPAAMTRALSRCAPVDELLVPAQRQGGAAGYSRHVLYADPAGRSPSSRSYGNAARRARCTRTIPGAATPWWRAPWLERGFRDAGGGAAAAMTESLRPPGSTVFDPARHAIHQLLNPGAERCISIHVYGVEPARVATGVNRVYDERLAATSP